ncbi:MAG TPA: hypothetical protein DG754_03730 [Bacteroidales bacterium]|jgi:hypothetical protein|nr:hypothetical protein [Bacteroidales bacterium]
MLIDCKVYKTGLIFQYILSTFTLILIFGVKSKNKNFVLYTAIMGIHFDIHVGLINLVLSVKLNRKPSNSSFASSGFKFLSQKQV